MPSAAATDVLAWPAPNGSYGDSLRIAKPERPPPLRIVEKRSRRPVRILCTYVWWLTSQTSLSVRQIEHAMQRERQLDDAEIRREVSAVDRARADEQIANLTCQDVDFVAFEAFDVGRRVDPLDDHWRGYTKLRADALRCRNDAGTESRRARRRLRKPARLRPVSW